MRRFVTLVRLALGGLLLIAAGLKGYELVSTSPVAGPGLLGRTGDALAIECEAMLGLWLLSGLWPAAAARVACLCFALFAGVSAWKVAHGQTSCGCFGRVPTHPGVSLTLDLLSIGGSLLVARGAGRHATPLAAGRMTAVAGLVLLLAASGLVVMLAPRAAARDEFHLVEVDPGAWLNQPWPWVQHVDLGRRLKVGRWAVLLYSSTCRHCQGTVEEYRELANRWKSQAESAQIALVDMSPGWLPDRGEPSDGSAVQGQFTGPPEWFLVTPTLVVLVDGQVKAVAQGEADCTWDDRRFRRW